MNAKIPVLLESTDDGYKATAGAPFNLSAEAATREEAMTSLQTLLRQQFAAGAELVEMSVDEGEHPLQRFVGWLPEDDLTEEWRQAIQERRQQIESADSP